MNNSRVVKRKVNATGIRNEPPQKALKKAEVLEQFHSLQAKFDALKEENRILLENQTSLEKENRILQENQNKHIEAINLLEETVMVLQNKANDNQKEHKETIDNMEENMKELRSKCENKSVYLCGECDYLADCVHDFNNHTHSPDDEENNDVSLFECRFCDESFGTLAEVMKHNKIIHTSNVQHCVNFLEKICMYGDDCWFIHSESLQVSEPSFKCELCEQKFRTKNSLREHMKLLHIQLVAKCKSEGECKFGPKKCWFVHQHDIEIAYFNAKNEDKRISQTYEVE